MSVRYQHQHSSHFDLSFAPPPLITLDSPSFQLPCYHRSRGSCNFGKQMSLVVRQTNPTSRGRDRSTPRGQAWPLGLNQCRSYLRDKRRDGCIVTSLQNTSNTRLLFFFFFHHCKRIRLSQMQWEISVGVCAPLSYLDRV